MIDYQEFRLLSAKDLANSFSNMVPTGIRDADVLAFVADRRNLDEAHLVFGMKIFGSYSPKQVIPAFLQDWANLEQAVAIAIYGIVENLSPVPEEVRAAVLSLEHGADSAANELADMMKMRV